VTLPRFLKPSVFAASTAAWMFIACFVWARDFLMVGPEAHGLQPFAMLQTTQSMVLWGLLSPLILVAAEYIDIDAGRRLRAVPLHAALALALCVIDVAVDVLLAPLTRNDGTFAQNFYAQVYINTFSYLAVAAVGYALVYYSRLTASHARALELQRELAQTRLEALARKLQPHFLFNALNTVAALVRLEDNKRALSALVALSDLLRVVLETRGEARVPLAEELRFTERYLAIEQLRFEDRLEVKTLIEPGTEQLLVPALILQPLVENAIRHGVETHGRGRVTLEAQVNAQVLDLRVKVETEGTAAEPQTAGLGIGLDVTRRRLAVLYGDNRFALDLSVATDQSSVTLRIPREVQT
jgi:two-component system LytT family sensor kinase